MTDARHARALELVRQEVGFHHADMATLWQRHDNYAHRNKASDRIQRPQICALVHLMTLWEVIVAHIYTIKLIN